MSASIALIKGKNRYQNIFQALKLIKKEIVSKIKDKKRVVIKVNLTSTDKELAVTNIEAVKAFLDFLKPIYFPKIKIVEMEARKDGLTNFGYHQLTKKYNVEIDNLSQSKLENFYLYDYQLRKKIKVQLYKTIIDSDYLVSITPAKTHNEGIITLSIKNVVVGSMKYPSPIHQGYQAFNKNLYLLAKRIPISLAVIDGTVGMEGNGPVDGTSIDSDFVIASTDALQADTIAAKLMGFNPLKIGYLYYLLQERRNCSKKIQVLGARISQCKKKFKPHPTYKKQLLWNQPPNLQDKFKSILFSKLLDDKKIEFLQKIKKLIIKQLN